MGKFDEASMAREMEEGARNINPDSKPVSSKGLEDYIKEQKAKDDLEAALEGGEFDKAFDAIKTPDEEFDLTIKEEK